MPAGGGGGEPWALAQAEAALRAIEALAAAIPLFLLVFAAAYVKLDSTQAQAFSEPLSRTDALYFTITVFSTVGFGDITPSPTRPASPP